MVMLPPWHSRIMEGHHNRAMEDMARHHKSKDTFRNKAACNKALVKTA